MISMSGIVAGVGTARTQAASDRRGGGVALGQGWAGYVGEFFLFGNKEIDHKRYLATISHS